MGGAPSGLFPFFLYGSGMPMHVRYPETFTTFTAERFGTSIPVYGCAGYSAVFSFPSWP